MKNIFKLIVASFFVSILLVACNNDADRDWTTPEASFKLYDTSLGVNNVLYETMKGNPFTLVWESVGSGEYSVILSSKEDFSTKTQLGTSTENRLTTTVGSLNAKLLELGFSPFVSQKLYIRIEKGSEVSNVISFGVTAYPISGPVITAPTNGSTIVLNSTDQSAIATTITWNDYSKYGVAIKYLVQMAKKGSTSYVSLGEVTIPNPNPNNVTRSLAISNKDLNTAALNAGGVVNEEGEFDFRVTAKSEFSTPAISLTSAIVTAKMKPYQVDYPDFYLVGGATAAGWSPSAAPKLLKKDNVSEIYTYLQPDEFRFLGQSDWNPINYSMDVAGIRDSYKYFKTVSSNITKGGGDENMKFTGTAGIYHVKINADFGVKSLTVEPSAGVWDIPNLYLVGTTNGWQAASAEQFNPVGNGVFEIVKELPVGSEFKFLAQQDWSGKEWGNIRSAGNTGYLGPNGDNNNIVVSNSTSATNFYTIRVDLKRGTYQLIPF